MTRRLLAQCSITLTLVLTLTSCNDPQENAYRFNRWLGFIALVVVALVAFAVGVWLGKRLHRVWRQRRAAS